MEASSTDRRIDELTDRVGRFEVDVKERFDKVDNKFERLEDKIDARFAKWDKYVIGGAVSIAGAVVYKVLGL